MFTPLDDVAHVIQTALTPAFLLAGLAALLGVFASRLDRVADRVEHLSRHTQTDDQPQVARSSKELARLHYRSQLLDVAVMLGAIGGGLICFAALLLFIGGFGPSAVTARVLLASFGLALVATIGAIAVFVVEMMLSSSAIRDVCNHRLKEDAVRLSKR